jgi:hypothetical protein
MEIWRFIVHQLKQLTKHSPGALLRRIATTAATLSLPLVVFAAAPSTQIFHAQLMPLNAPVGGGAEGIVTLTIKKRVICVHGVADSHHLPATVHSLPDVPAKMTIPVACGVIRAST